MLKFQCFINRKYVQKFGARFEKSALKKRLKFLNLMTDLKVKK